MSSPNTNGVYRLKKLTTEESRDIINYIAQKRGISTEKLLSTIKPNLKRKNTQNLTYEKPSKLTKAPQNMVQTQQKLTKTQKNLIKTQENLIKTQKNLIKTKSQQKRKNTQNLTYEKPSKLAKRENLTSQKQQIMSKNKKRIETIREKLKELHHKLFFKKKHNKTWQKSDRDPMKHVSCILEVLTKNL